jgi:hypothetical protein
MKAHDFKIVERPTENSPTLAERKQAFAEHFWSTGLINLQEFLRRDTNRGEVPDWAAALHTLEVRRGNPVFCRDFVRAFDLLPGTVVDLLTAGQGISAAYGIICASLMDPSLAASHPEWKRGACPVCFIRDEWNSEAEYANLTGA